MNIPDINLPRVVIIGGGFAGLNLAHKLKHKEVQVVLLDKHNYHTFQPLLYQVASAGLEPDSIAFPLRKLFVKQTNIYFRMAQAQEVDTKKKVLKTDIGPVWFDHLVIATGSETNYFGMKNLEKLAMPMKSIPEALNLRSLLLQNFEKALLTDDLKERERLMNVVIVGGGPTGVELAGALAELKMHVLPTDYPDLDIRRMQIHLVEMADQLLPPMSEAASKKSKAFLKKLGVNIWLKTSVKDYDGNVVYTDNEKELETHTLIWTAGVKGAPVDGLPEDSINKGGRIITNEYNKVEGTEGIYAIGDVAAIKTEADGKGHPMLAQVAIQQGTHLAKNILRMVDGKEPKAFKYKDKGTLATIGRNKAVADLPGYKTQGFLAWFIWMFVHIWQLAGFRNKLVTLINWMWNYFNYDRGVRLIIRPFKKAAHPVAEEKVEGE